MIKLIIFDLDGVLADTEHIHYTSLLSAIKSVTGINSSGIKQDGSTTRQKLYKLQKEYNLSDDQINEIDKIKQLTVIERISALTPDLSQIDMLGNLRQLVGCLAVGSNSRRANVAITLERLEISNFFTYILSSEDIAKPKPDSEIFLKIIELANVLPTETLILEDSENGLTAAYNTGAHVLKIESCADTNLENIIDAINKTDSYSPDGWDGF